MSMILLGRIHK